MKYTVRLIQHDDDLFTYASLCKFDIINVFCARFCSIAYFFFENPLTINGITILFLKEIILSTVLLQKLYPAHIITGMKISKLVHG